MKQEDILELMDEDATYLLPEYYFEAVVGFSSDGALIYDYDLMVELIMINDKMSYEDAVEWIEVNTIPTLPYMGKKRPVIMNKISSYERV